MATIYQASGMHPIGDTRMACGEYLLRDVADAEMYRDTTAGPDTSVVIASGVAILTEVPATSLGGPDYQQQQRDHQAALTALARAGRLVCGAGYTKYYDVRDRVKFRAAAERHCQGYSIDD